MRPTGRPRFARLVPPLVLLGALVAPLLPATAAQAAPATRTPGRAIEGFAPYQPQTTCSPTAKPGTVALRTVVLKAYGGTGDYGIIRSCALGGRSEHKEGRAWDWKVSTGNAAQVRQVNDLLRWLLATDAYGNTNAQARRLGIMYVIWNHRIWNAGSHTWKAYNGSDPHTTHVHLSLSWSGALKKTSYWTGKVSGPVAAPQPPAAPKPAPKPTPKPAPKPVPKPVPLVAPATLRVSSSAAAPTRSPFLLVAGKRYLLKATGTYSYARGKVADAECSLLPDGSWSRHLPDAPDGRADQRLDLQVQGAPTRWSTQDRDRCDSTGHTYWTVVEPTTTGPLALRVQDVTPADNAGVLSVVVSPLAEAYRH